MADEEKIHSLRERLLFTIGGILGAIFIIGGVFLGLFINRAIGIINDSYLQSVSKTNAKETKITFANAYIDCLSLSRSVGLTQNVPEEYRRNHINETLKQTLKSHSEYVDAWFVSEPNAIDGLDDDFAGTEGYDETGRMIPYWTNINGNIDCSPLTDYEGSFWYENPLRSQEGVLIEPNLYELQGKQMFVGGVAAPVRTPEGKTLGSIGLDFDWASVSKTLKKNKVFDTGYLVLISDGGLIAAGPNENDIGKPSKIIERNKSLFDNARNSLANFSFEAKDAVLGKTCRYFVEPFKIGNAKETWFLAVVAPVNEMNRQKNAPVTAIIITFIISLILGIVISGYVITKTVLQIRDCADAMKNIAQGDGDLTVQLKIHHNDELGLLSKYFNQTMDKIRTSISSVKTEAQNVENMGDTLAADMNETAAAVNQIKSNIDSVNHQVQVQGQSVEEASNSVSTINLSVQGLLENIQSQGNSVAQASSAIEEMVANIRSVTGILQKNSESMQQLSTSSEEGRSSVAGTVAFTGEIEEQSQSLLQASSMISNIASQTNLLAMNAAIEAAHAGEAGKGFSVVADEIRKLAEDSGKQGKAITANLKQVISSIHKIAESTSNLQKKFNEIYSLTKTVDQQEHVIMNAMQEQSDGGEQVLSAMKKIQDVTVSVKDGGDQMGKASDSVNRSMEKLSRLSQEITVSMNEMAQGTANINESINSVNDSTKQTRDSIQKVADEVAKFKV